MMKTTIILLLIALVGVFGQNWMDPKDAFGQTKSWTGNTSASTTMFAAPVNAQGTTPTSCIPRTHQTPYYYVEVNFPTSGVRQVGAMAELAFKPHLQVWLYTSFNPSSPCAGLVRGLYNGNYLGDSGIMTINDPVFFQGNTTYQLVVTSGDDTLVGGAFALSIFATTAAGTTVGSPSWVPATTNTGPCTPNTALGNQNVSVFTWAQTDTGAFDIQVFFENANEPALTITQNFVTFAIYKGSFTAAQLSGTANQCPLNAIDITGGEADLMVAVLYHNLTEDTTYTIAVSNKFSGNYGIQILPTRVNTRLNGAYTQPSKSPVSCTASALTNSGYVLPKAITSQYDTHFFDTYQLPTYGYVISFPEETFAYSGTVTADGNGNIAACGTGVTVLAAVNTGANSTATTTASSSNGPLIASTTKGQVYSLVIADFYGDNLTVPAKAGTIPPTQWASQLFVLAGNTITASTTITSSTASVTTSTTSGTGVTTGTTGTTGTSGAVTSGNTTAPSSTTTTGASSNPTTTSTGVTSNPTTSSTHPATTSGAATLSFSAFFLLAAFLALF